MIKKRNREFWIMHCFLHPGVRWIDISFPINGIYGLLTLEDKYMIYSMDLHQYLTPMDEEKIAMIRYVFCDNHERALNHIREIDYIRMIKDRSFDFDEVTECIGDTDCFESTRICNLLEIIYPQEMEMIDAYPAACRLYRRQMKIGIDLSSVIIRF
jgi:hypothetical protein